MTTPQLHRFAPSGGIPNNALPLLIWKHRLPAGANGVAVCALYERNGWTGTWIYHVFPFWHFHTRGHEVLSCVAGDARIGLGGEGGTVANVTQGDVIAIPAGVGHRRIESSPDFLVAGAYPPGQAGNIVRPGDMGEAAMMNEIGKVKLPRTDPVSGGRDGVVSAWSAPAA